MRMNNTKGLSAQDWLATTDKDEIAWVLSAYGEESYAEKIADQIVTRREKRPLTTTKDLVETVLAAVPTIAKGKHPATRVFQAIRMHINAELDEIRYGIPQAINQLTRSGRLVVISYHSLEHKLVSEVVKQAKINSEFSASTSKPPKLRKVGHAKKASRQELFANRRARSALLRTWEIK
jgi:16S rRNA (cytosine1402-N4)-methyltransferase